MTVKHFKGTFFRNEDAVKIGKTNWLVVEAFRTQTEAVREARKLDAKTTESRTFAVVNTSGRSKISPGLTVSNSVFPWLIVTVLGNFRG